MNDGGGPFEIVFLGTGTCVPSVQRGSPGLAVRIGEDRVLLDGGSGSLRNLLRAGWDYRDVTHLLYTHVHPDHSADLVPLLTALEHTPGFTRTAPLRAYGPPGFIEFFEQVTAAYPVPLESDTYEIRVEEVGETECEQDGWRFVARFLQHPVLNAGYRIEVPALGRTMVYTGDTEPCPQLVELARDVDLLIAECSSPDDMRMKGHMTPSGIGRIAEEAAARRVLLTHLYPASDREDILSACRKYYSGPVDRAEDLMRVSLA